MKRLKLFLACLFRGHDWLYDHPNCNRARLCKRCHKCQSFELVDCGMSKAWITYEVEPYD